MKAGKQDEKKNVLDETLWTLSQRRVVPPAVERSHTTTQFETWNTEGGRDESESEQRDIWMRRAIQDIKAITTTESNINYNQNYNQSISQHWHKESTQKKLQGVGAPVVAWQPAPRESSGFGPRCQCTHTCVATDCSTPAKDAATMTAPRRHASIAQPWMEDVKKKKSKKIQRKRTKDS